MNVGFTSLSARDIPITSCDYDDIQKILLGNAKRNARFTEKIIKHGIWTDTSLASATRQKMREQEQQRRRVSSIERVNKSFEAEALHVKKLQQMLAQKQRHMATAAVERYSAVCIQTIYRRWLAMCELHYRKMGRFISIWVKYAFIYRERRRAAKKIVLSIRKAKSRRLCNVVMRLLRDVHTLLRCVRRWLARRKALRVLIMKRNRQQVLKFAFNFGLTRAANHIIRNKYTPEDVQANIIMTRLLAKAARKRRLRK